ncbi:MAG: carbohydrate ABC transporter permease [Clostridia bacterium]
MQRKKESIGDRAFNACNVALMIVVIFVTLYPFWYVVVCSFSSIAHVIGNGFILWPDGLHVEAYQQIFRNNLVPTGYRNTLLITGVGTILSMAISVTGAYALSVKKLPGRTGITFFVVFTMLFSGGMVPTYLVVCQLKLVDTLWALILPSAVNAYNVILLRNFFQSVPDELYEAASIDGITAGGYLWRIMLPLSSASIATIGMFYAVSYWNAYFNAVIYIRDSTLWPMQMILRQILMTNQFNTMMYDDAAQSLASETLKNAMIVITVLPIVCVYPFIQKYFVKGIMVGSLKG